MKKKKVSKAGLKARAAFKKFMVYSGSVFVVAVIAILTLGAKHAFGQEAATAAQAAVDPMARALAYVGIGIAIGLGSIGAGIAVGPVASAALGAITEKPEMLGRSFIFLGMAEGIAIYGLLIGFIMLSKF